VLALLFPSTVVLVLCSRDGLPFAQLSLSSALTATLALGPWVLALSQRTWSRRAFYISRPPSSLLAWNPLQGCLGPSVPAITSLLYSSSSSSHTIISQTNARTSSFLIGSTQAFQLHQVSIIIIIIILIFIYLILILHDFLSRTHGPR